MCAWTNGYDMQLLPLESLQHFELTLHKGKSSVRAVFWDIAQIPLIGPAVGGSALRPAPKVNPDFFYFRREG